MVGERVSGQRRAHGHVNKGKMVMGESRPRQSGGYMGLADVCVCVMSIGLVHVRWKT